MKLNPSASAAITLLAAGLLALAGCQSSGGQNGSPPAPQPPSQQPPASPQPSGGTTPSPPSGQQPAPTSQGQPSPGSDDAAVGDAEPRAGEEQEGSQQDGDAAPRAADEASAQPSGDSATADAAAEQQGDEDAVLRRAIEAFERGAAQRRGEDQAAEQGPAPARIPDPGEIAEAEQSPAEGGTDAGTSGEEPAAEATAREPGPWYRPGGTTEAGEPDPEAVYGEAEGAPDEAGEAAGDGDTAASHEELERVLAERMGEFDGEILAEREAILSRRASDSGDGDEDTGASAASGEAGSDGADGAAGEGASGEEQVAGVPGAGRDGRDEAGRHPAPAAPGRETADAGGGVGSGPGGREGAATRTASIDDAHVPEDVGDGADDDVVAAQLREAAMNEEDPELREKLWEEYRRYKDRS